MAPADPTPSEIYVTRNGTTVWMTDRGTIDIRSSDGSLVSVQDLDGTGRFTLVSYDAIDPSDGQKYSFTDANADGRLDSKIGQQAGFVNLDGQWSRLEKRGNQLGALVNGEWRPLEKQGKLLFQLKSP
jgi:DNA-binding beta-propeller fold protein YncE